MYTVTMILDPLYIAYGAAAIAAILIGWVIRLEIKLNRLTAGKNGASLEEAIAEAHTAIGRMQHFQKESLGYYEEIEKRISRSIQAVETVRFNPFKGTGEGGNQSFSTALVSENGDGVVVSSLYSRDRVSIFSKPLKSFASEFELTEEEQAVVQEAQKNLK